MGEPTHAERGTRPSPQRGDPDEHRVPPPARADRPPRPDRSQRPTPAAQHTRRGPAAPTTATGTPPAPRPTAGEPLGGVVVEQWRTAVCAMSAAAGMRLGHSRAWGGCAKYAMVCALQPLVRAQRSPEAGSGAAPPCAALRTAHAVEEETMDHPTHSAAPTAPGPASPQEFVQHLRGYEGGLPEAVRQPLVTAGATIVPALITVVEDA